METGFEQLAQKAGNRNIQGIVLMIGGMFLFACMDAVAKWLVEEDLSPVQVLAIRSWFILSIILFVVGVRGELKALIPRQPLAHGLRGFAGFFAPLCFFYALKELPLADAVVIFFSSTFILTAMSALIFKEQVGIHRWGAVIVGFCGVLVAMNPQGDGHLSAYLLVLASSSIYAMLLITGKQLTSNGSILTVVFSQNFMMGLVSTILLPLVWMPVSFQLLEILLGMALLAVSGHFVLTAAFSRAQVSTIAPFEYSALIWAVLLGFIFWSEIPTKRVLLGAAIIIVSGLYVIYRESLARKTL